jgi:hypothetical protein
VKGVLGCSFTKFYGVGMAMGFDSLLLLYYTVPETDGMAWEIKEEMARMPLVQT